MRKMITLCFILIFMTVSAAYAQINPKTYSVSPFFGGYVFDGVENQDMSPVAGLRVGYDFTRHLGLEALFEYTRSEYNNNPPVVESFPQVGGYRLEGLYHFMPQSRLVPYVAVGVGGRSIRFKDLDLDRNHAVLDYGIGVKYFLYKDLAIRGDVRHIFLLNDNLNNLEYTVGISYYFGGPKPVKMETQREMPAEQPKVMAPPPPPPPPLMAPMNLDATAISESQINVGWNSVDAATGYKVYRDGAFLTSSRGPSLSDTGLRADTRYCYVATATDDMGRESARSNEDCATTPAPPVVQKPAPPVVMEQKKEPPAAVAAVAKEMFEKGRATINIEFDTNKTNIKPKYSDEIKKFADVMKLYPDLKVIIEGHTDSVGGQAYNQKLSQRRAESVKNYMVKTFGIDASRLQAKGYGMTKPIDSNKTAKGRQKNRRVEAAVDYTKKK
jgi:OmpA-OmpF porin, OOP family